MEYHQLRNWEQYKLVDRVSKEYCFVRAACITSVFLLVLILTVAGCQSPAPAADRTDNNVRAIIGEASGEGYQGMLAVACAIRNRGSLAGVYGLRSSHVDKQPEAVWVTAQQAWEDSKDVDVTYGATHWENIKAFGEPYWAKTMTITTKVGNHVFYR